MRPDSTPVFDNPPHDDCAQGASRQAKILTRSGWHASTRSRRPVLTAGSVEAGDGTSCNGTVICQTETGTFLYMANFIHGTIDVFDCHRNQIGSFTDPDLPRGYGPLDLQLVDSSLFVTFVPRDVVHRDERAEPEHGFIVEFDPDGIMLGRAEFPWGRRFGAGWYRRTGPAAATEFRRKQGPCLW